MHSRSDWQRAQNFIERPRNGGIGVRHCTPDRLSLAFTAPAGTSLDVSTACFAPRMSHPDNRIDAESRPSTDRYALDPAGAAEWEIETSSHSTSFTTGCPPCVGVELSPEI
jgi:hypothetical protein